MGRKGKHQKWLEEDGLAMLQSWARDGLTDPQMAKNIGISYSTFKVWKNKFPALSATLKKGKEPIDFEVENALLKRALGYEYEETSSIVEKDAKGKLITKIIKHKKIMPPDTTAAIFWLKNRKPDTWKKLASSVEIKNQKELEKLTFETKMLEYEVEKFEKSNQVNTLLESLVNVVEPEKKTD